MSLDVKLVSSGLQRDRGMLSKNRAFACTGRDGKAASQGVTAGWENVETLRRNCTSKVTREDAALSLGQTTTGDAEGSCTVQRNLTGNLDGFRAFLVLRYPRALVVNLAHACSSSNRFL